MAVLTSNPAVLTWALPDLVLTPGSGTEPVGGTHTVTATETYGSGPLPVAGASVTFTVVSGPNAGQTGVVVTDASGVASFAYPDTGGEGTDTIEATADGVTSNQATCQWVLYQIVLLPALATNPVSTTHTLVAVVTDSVGNPVAGVLVTLDCLSGPDLGLGLDAQPTDGAGEATLHYTNTGATGDDILVATVGVGTGVPVVLTSAPVTKTWAVAWDRNAGPCDLPGTASTGGAGCAGDVASAGT